MPVCKLVSVDYLNRTGKQGALIGILFLFGSTISGVDIEISLSIPIPDFLFLN